MNSQHRSQCFYAKIPRLHSSLLPTMKAILTALVVLLALLVLPAGAAEKRVALVIGNAAYPTALLGNPVNDSNDITAALQKLGFEVIQKNNANQREMNRAIVEFGEKLRSDTVALFFYAGHGIQVKGKNYLIPVDARIASESSVRAETVDVDTVMDQLATSTLNIVILDACRNNPFERGFRGTGGGLAQMDAPTGSLIAYATSPGKTAADGGGRNGLYTQELLKHIQTPGMPLEAIFKRVRNGVIQGSGSTQTPWEVSSLTGDFYFTPSNGGQIAIAAPPLSQLTAVRPSNPRPSPYEAQNANASPRGDPETQFWTEVKSSGDRGYLDAYLKQYPKGKYLSLARLELQKIDTREKEQKLLEEDSFRRIDQEAWDRVKQNDNVAGYTKYINDYPKGQYAVLAQIARQKTERQVAEQQKDLAVRAEQQSWLQAKAENTSLGYDHYLQKYPQGVYVSVAEMAKKSAQQEESIKLLRNRGKIADQCNSDNDCSQELLCYRLSGTCQKR